MRHPETILEDGLAPFRLHTVALIRHPDLHLVWGPVANREFNRRAVRRVFDRVAEQIFDHATKPVTPTMDRPNRAVSPKNQTMAGAFPRNRIRRLADQRVQVDVFALHRNRRIECPVNQLADHLGDAPHGLGDRVRPFGRRPPIVRFHADQAGDAENALQRAAVQIVPELQQITPGNFQGFIRLLGRSRHWIEVAVFHDSSIQPLEAGWDGLGLCVIPFGRRIPPPEAKGFFQIYGVGTLGQSWAVAPNCRVSPLATHQQAMKKEQSPKRRKNAASTNADSLPPNTARFTIDPNSNTGIVDIEWRSHGSEEIHQYSPTAKQNVDSLRALAIAMLCAQHCRNKGSDALRALGTLALKKVKGGWQIQAKQSGQTFLQTLGNAFENKSQKKDRKTGGNRQNEFGRLQNELPQFVGKSPAWYASRNKATGFPSFWCQNPPLADTGHQTGGPGLLFRRHGSTADLEADKLLPMARELEDSQAGEWRPLLTPGLDPRFRHFANYLKKVAEDCSTLETRGIDLGEESLQRALSLAEVYVGLQTKTPRPGENPGREPEDKKPPLSVLEVLFDNKSPHVVLTGQPGSGKSTLAQFVTLCLAEQLSPRARKPGYVAADKIPEELQRVQTLPFRIVLRDFADGLTDTAAGRAKPVVDHLVGMLQDRGSDDAARILPSLLKEGLAFVLFDGLDEVPAVRLPTIRQIIGEFSSSDYGNSRIAVTCRVESYKQDDFRIEALPEPHEIAPLSEDLQAKLVHQFYLELEQCQPQFAGEGAGCETSLKRAIKDEQLNDLAGVPFFLVSMAGMHRPDAPLPKTSAGLMDRLVRSALTESTKIRVRVDSGKSSEPELGALLKSLGANPDDLRAGLEAVAFHAREQADRGTNRKIALALLKEDLVMANNQPADWVEKKLLPALQHRAGILQSRDGRNFEFAYRFEEFLAGCHLAKRDAWPAESLFHERAEQLLLEQKDYARQVVLWAAGYNAHVQKGDRNTVRELVALLLQANQPAEEVLGGMSRLKLAADIAVDAGMEEWVERRVPGTADTVQKLRAQLAEARDNKLLKCSDRSVAASALGRLGDTRDGVGLREDGLLEFAWSDELKAGEFRLGETGEVVQIPRSYQISRYPITVGQFQAFVDQGGYRDDGSEADAKRLQRWWGAEGLKRKRENKIDGPADYDPEFQTPNHPRVGVSWFEANAFCHWATEASPIGEVIRLPHEAEWEQAARWNKNDGEADDRRFPWGNTDDEELPERCNMNKSGIGHTSAVGLFPTGVADCGAFDLSGNVWEWCANWYDEDEDSRVVRGGSWVYYYPDVFACAYRGNDHPEFRLRFYSFRVVLCSG